MRDVGPGNELILAKESLRCPRRREAPGRRDDRRDQGHGKSGKDRGHEKSNGRGNGHETGDGPNQGTESGRGPEVLTGSEEGTIGVLVLDPDDDQRPKTAGGEDGREVGREQESIGRGRDGRAADKTRHRAVNQCSDQPALYDFALLRVYYYFLECSFTIICP